MNEIAVARPGGDPPFTDPHLQRVPARLVAAFERDHILMVQLIENRLRRDAELRGGRSFGREATGAARVSCELVLVAPYDVVGEARQPNLPGTVDEYPNWRLPLPFSLDELRDHPLLNAVVAEVRRRRPR